MASTEDTIMHTKVSAVFAPLALLALAGCASFSKDGGFTSVEQTTRQRIGKDVKWARSDADRDALDAQVKELLARPLSADDAVQVALYNNRGLQAAFQELGISEADLVQAGRLPNPRFQMFHANRGDNYKIEQTLTMNIFALITLPLAQEVGQRRFERTQREVAMEVLRLATDTRKAWTLAVAAEESVRYARQVRTVADTGAELARRMEATGNWNRLQRNREQGFYADAALNLARAEQAAITARERLTRLLGLWGAQTQYRLPERLPDLPAAPEDLPNIEQLAMEQRLDLQAVRLETEALAKNLGLTKTTRFINVLELGPARVLEGPRSDPWKNGYEISFEIPLFDWGTARVAKAEAIYLQAVNRAADTAISARSEVREAYQGYRASYDIAKHYRDEIVPLRKRIADENLLRYNGMLIGTFELLADARAQIASVNSYFDALRDYWLARADLDMALIGRPGPGAAAIATAPAQAAAGH
jgi:outer membrane protein TolC